MAERVRCPFPSLTAAQVAQIWILHDKIFGMIVLKLGVRMWCLNYNCSNYNLPRWVACPWLGSSAKRRMASNQKPFCPFLYTFGFVAFGNIRVRLCLCIVHSCHWYWATYLTTLIRSPIWNGNNSESFVLHPNDWFHSHLKGGPNLLPRVKWTKLLCDLCPWIRQNRSKFQLALRFSAHLVPPLSKSSHFEKKNLVKSRLRRIYRSIK
jgi:hypothetical protein